MYCILYIEEFTCGVAVCRPVVINVSNFKVAINCRTNWWICRHSATYVLYVALNQNLRCQGVLAR